MQGTELSSVPEEPPWSTVIFMGTANVNFLQKMDTHTQMENYHSLVHADKYLSHTYYVNILLTRACRCAMTKEQVCAHAGIKKPVDIRQRADNQNI
jgi:hypothetical protein